MAKRKFTIEFPGSDSPAEAVAILDALRTRVGATTYDMLLLMLLQRESKRIRNDPLMQSIFTAAALAMKARVPAL